MKLVVTDFHGGPEGLMDPNVALKKERNHSQQTIYSREFTRLSLWFFAPVAP